jgi:hypothetical protein
MTHVTHRLMTGALVLQPHGFEGLLASVVEPPSDYPSVVKGYDPHAVRFNLYSVPTPEACSVWRHDVLTALNELIHCHDNRIERVKEGAPEGSDCLASVVDACLKSSRPRPIQHTISRSLS